MFVLSDRTLLNLRWLNRLLAKIWLSIVFPIFKVLYQEASLCCGRFSELTLAATVQYPAKDNTATIFFAKWQPNCDCQGWMKK